MAMPNAKELQVLQGLVEFVREKTNYINEDDNLLQIINYLKE